jgi:hypothetical protein
VSRLEQRYRRVLRTLLPASYRKQWEEEMVATFVQGFVEDFLKSVDADDPEAAEYAQYAADFGRLGTSSRARCSGSSGRSSPDRTCS